jgi:hypothetical protein
MKRRETLGYGVASAAAAAIAARCLPAGPNHVAPPGKIGPVGDALKAAAGSYSVRAFGAAGDGNTLDTQAINRSSRNEAARFARSRTGSTRDVFPHGNSRRFFPGG